MQRKLLLFTIFCCWLCATGAQNLKALVIGINTYKPADAAKYSANGRLWRNLQGCLNDASAMKDVLQAKYGFTNNNIVTLFNEQANRAAIIKALDDLVANAQKGDAIFIFYAGHGSQMRNSLSVEEDKKDETIVPSDAFKGAMDIRDKELATYFNKLLDKGVILTVIFDSCHSGSVGRGFLFDPPTVRYVDESSFDAKDPSNPQRPELRGALIISSAQDFEFAKEEKDENGIVHGAFSSALLKALQLHPADASVQEIFESISAIMNYNGKTQEPVLAANTQRKEATLLGLPNSALRKNFAIAVSKKEVNAIELSGGYAFGLSEGVRLAGVNSSDTLEITEMRGANKSLAKLVAGNFNKISAGALFRVVNWSTGKAPALKVYLPKNGLSDNKLQETLKTFEAIKNNKQVNWITDVTKTNPDAGYFFDGEKWNVVDKNTGKSVVNNMASLPSSVKAASSVFVNFAPSATMVNELEKIFSEYNNIEIVSNPNESQYSLVGTLTNDGLQYSWIKTQVTVQDTSGGLPAKTDAVAYRFTDASAKEISQSLSDYAFRIAKIRAWLTLSPPVDSLSQFPFKLVFQKSDGQSLATNRVKVNESLSLFLQYDKNSGKWNQRKRYVYVFAIDSKGAMTLLYPMAQSGNVENRLPNVDPRGMIEEKKHLVDIDIVPPTGTDHYFMLSSEEPIENLSAFEQEGVISRGPEKKLKPIEALLYTGTRARSEIVTPITWSIYKLTLQSVE